MFGFRVMFIVLGSFVGKFDSEFGYKDLGFGFSG